MTKHANRALAVVIALGGYLLVTSAFYPIESLSVFDAKRVLQLMLFTAVLLFAVIWAPLRAATIAQLGRLSLFNGSILALFFLIGIISSLRLDHPAYALIDVSMIFVMLVLIAVVAGSRELSGESFDKWAVLLLASLGLAVAIQELIGFIANWVLGAEFSYTQALIHFAHPRFYNQLQTWSIPVLAALPLLFPERRWIKLVCTVLLGLQWFLVIAYAARGTAVSLFIAMVFVALWCKDQRKFWLKYQVTGLLAGVIIYVGILQLNGLVIPQSQSGEFYVHSAGRPMLHTTGRSHLWRLSAREAIKYPLLGAGPTRYACNSHLTLPAHPHSFPVRITGEWGLIAIFLVLVLATNTGWHLLRNLKQQQNGHQTDPPLKTMLAISLMAGLIHSCVSGLLIMPASQVLMILVVGWILSLYDKAPSQLKRHPISVLVLLVSTIVALAQLTFSMCEIPNLSVRTAYSSNYGPVVPRFWQDGRVCNYAYEKTPGIE